MDFTGDGIADILSGSYWSDDPNCAGGNPQAGYIYLLAGKDDSSFEEAVPLLNAEDKPLTNVPLSQEKLDNYSTDDIEWANICTCQHAADYDGDGDLDLVGGEMGSGIYVHINSASSTTDPPKFSQPQKITDSPDAHSNPHLVDWDGDGDLDLISGGESGSVYLSINEGTATDPRWAGFERLIKLEASYQQTTDGGAEIEPGRNSRVWATDFNNDGKMDLLVGDSTTIENKIPGLSEEEAAKLKAEYDAEMDLLHEKMQAVYGKYEDEMKEAMSDGGAAMLEMRETIEKEMEPVTEEMAELHEKERQFIDRTSTGHIWVHLQK